MKRSAFFKQQSYCRDFFKWTTVECMSHIQHPACLMNMCSKFIKSHVLINTPLLVEHFSR